MDASKKFIPVPVHGFYCIEPEVNKLKICLLKKNNISNLFQQNRPTLSFVSRKFGLIDASMDKNLPIDIQGFHLFVKKIKNVLLI